MLRNSVQAAPLMSLNSASFNNAYQPFLISSTATPLPAACYELRVTNNSAAQGVTISFDGVTAHEYVPFGTSIVIQAGSQASSPQNSTALFPKGLQVYGLGATTSTGYVYLSAYYQVSQ